MGRAILYVAFSGRKPEAVANDVARMLGGSQISEQDGFLMVSGSSGDNYVAAAVMPENSGTQVLTSEKLLRAAPLYRVSLRPILFKWALEPTSGLEWLIDESRLPAGYELERALFRHRVGASYFDYGYQKRSAASVLNQWVINNLPSFAIVSADFRREALSLKNGSGSELAADLSETDSILVEWDGLVVATFPRIHRDDEEHILEQAAAAYASLSRALNFEVVSASMARLKAAGFGVFMREMYERNNLHRTA